MAKIIHILRITGVALASAIIILTATSLFFQDKVADIVLKNLNEKILTKYEYNSLNFSLIKNFPKASLVLKDVVVYSSQGFDKRAFPNINTDTLLLASSLSVDFKLLDMIGGNYNMDNINVKNGSLTLLCDNNGDVNYKFSANNDPGKNFILDLNRINISNITTYYQNTASDIIINGNIKKGSLKSKITQQDLDFSANADVDINLLHVAYLHLTNELETNIDLKLENSNDILTFNKSSIKINKNLLLLAGTISKDNTLDLSISGKDLNVTQAKDYLPENIKQKIANFSPAGKLNINGTVKGNVSHTVMPAISFNFNLDKGSVKNVGSSETINNLTVIGTYSNGSQKSSATSSLKIDDMTGAVADYIFRGSMNLQNFITPYISVVFDGHGDAADIIDFFKFKDISSASGMFDVNIKAKGTYERDKKYTMADILSFNPSIVAVADSFNINLKDDKFVLQQVAGKLSVTNDIEADNVRFLYKDQYISIDGLFKNLTRWLMGQEVTVTSSASVKANRLFPETFLNDNISIEKQNSNVAANDKNANSTKSIKFPENLIMDVNLDIEEFGYKSFHANNIKGNVGYKPTILNIKSLQLNTFNGYLDAVGFLVKNSDKSVMSHGTFNFNDIDIHECFDVFNNFGQNYLKAENIEGKLSGNMSALVSMDSLFVPNLKTLLVEGEYQIANGALLNFDPVMKLSNFIELPDLENIKFENLENELIIKNNLVYIPQMDIKSSAADLTVNGQHSFDNEYEYHIKVLLSEILSNKYKDRRKSNLEFGAVQDDGLGRTRIMLTINNKGVKYDMKAAGEQIKNEIKEEKKAIKAILNEEYGWFNNDKSVKQKSEETKKANETKISVEWEEFDNEEFDNKEEENIPITNEEDIESSKDSSTEKQKTESSTPRFKINWDDN